MTIIVNLFGGPGSGKSTSAAGIFSALKRESISCELVTEYAKEVVWSENTSLLDDQKHIFDVQFERQRRLVGKVDYVITDSPILLSVVYYKRRMKALNQELNEYHQMMLDYFKSTFSIFSNMNWLINRAKPYQQVGRVQSEEEAKKIDDEILTALSEMDMLFNLSETDSMIAIDDVVAAIKQHEQVKRY